jgi:putative peptidoglycan lipid II flippase
VRNDEQPPQQGLPPSQQYTSWSYSEDTQSPDPAAGPPLRADQSPNNPNRPYSLDQFPPGQLPDPNNPAPQIYSTPYYPDITVDMGNTMSYGQTMGFHPISIPQHSQPIPKLRRQERFQQSREESMRLQQRRINPDATSLGMRGLPTNRSTFPAGPVADPSIVQRGAPNETAGPQFIAPPFSPLPGNRVEQGPAFSQADAYANSVALANPTQIQPAASPAQDTGMIQRVKVARAAFLLTGAFVASSILGLLETFLFSYNFGSTTFSDAYFQAYIIPNLIYNVVSGGALSSAFIPVFTTYETGRKDEKTAWHIASSSLNLSVVLMLVLSVFAVIFAPEIVPLYSPGFSPAELSLTITLTRLMFLQAIVLGSGVIVTAVLNAKQDFTLIAAGTVLYNVGLIIGLVPGFLQALHSAPNTPPTDLAVYSATLGVVLAAVLQVGVQLPGLRKVKMRYSFSFDWRHPGVIQIARQMVPRVINAVMLSFSTAVDRFLLNFIATGASGLITDYFQAFSILVLPVSLFASSVSTAAFPTLASYVARGRMDRVRDIITETLRGILFLAIPSCVGLIVLSLPVVQVLVEHGKFSLQEAQFTSIALAFFAIGLPPLAAVEILTRSFYALQDSRTPVTISVAQFILKIAMSIILINLASYGVQWGMGGLSLSTSIASLLEAIVLFLLLSQRIGGFDLRRLGHFLGRVLLASAVLALVLICLRTLLDHIIDTTTVQYLYGQNILKATFKLLIELGVGSGIFLVVARLLKIEEMNSGLVRRVLNILHIPWL